MAGVNMFGGNKPQTSPPTSNNAGVNMFGVPQDASQVDVPHDPQANPQAEQGAIPPGAKGLDEKGNPYWGDNLAGMTKKWAWNFTKNADLTAQFVKMQDERGSQSFLEKMNPFPALGWMGRALLQGGTQSTDADWKALKDKWAKINAPKEAIAGGGNNARGAAMTGNLTPEQQAQVDQRAGDLGGAVKDTWNLFSSQGSLLSPVLRTVSTSVQAIGDLFSIPAKATEQTFGAVKGAMEYANKVDAPIPQLDTKDPFQKFLSNTTVGAAYDFARLALSPSDDKWNGLGKAIEEGWQSGRIMYSQVFDDTLKEKFLQEYRAGGDPQLIAEKLQNPWAELGGQLLLDPINLVGAFAKGAKTAEQLNRISKEVKGGIYASEEGIAALKMMSEGADDVTAAEAIKKLVSAQKKVVEEVQTGSKLLNVTYDTGSLTASSRQNALIAKGREDIANMALVLKKSGMSYDGIAEAIVRGMQSVSKNEDEVMMGLKGLANLPNPEIWGNKSYIETFTMMHKLMADEEGLLTGVKLTSLMKAKNPAEFAEASTKLLRAAVLQEFPDVSKMREASLLVGKMKAGETVTEETQQMAKLYNDLPNHVKYADNIDREFSKWIKNPINKPLSIAYFNLQGGVAVKNVLANSELILIDQGLKAWVRDGKFWSTSDNVNYLKDAIGGIENSQSAGGFTSLVHAVTGQDGLGAVELANAEGIGAKAKLVGKAFTKQGFGVAMSIGEEGSAIRVVASSVHNTFSEMLPKALSEHLVQGIKDGVMTQAQANYFTERVLKNGGNLEKSLEEYRNFYKMGAVEQWRNLDHVSEFQRKALDKAGYWEPIQELAHNPNSTKEDVEKLFETIKNSVSSRGGMAVDDLIGLSPDHPGAPAWGDLMKAVEDGHLDPNDQQVFTAIMESAEQARLDYQNLLDDVVLKATTSLSQEGRVAEAQHIGQEMNRVRSVLRKAGPETAKEAQTITQDAWRWSDAIKEEKKLTPEKLVEFWNKAGLKGNPPLDLNKKTLLKELWAQRFTDVKGAWNGSFDALVSESETVLKQMEGVVDATELKSMATRTRNITEQAQAYRSAVYDGKALRIKQNKSVLDLAHEYGLATVTEAGKKLDNVLLTTVNKYSEGGKQFTKLDEIPYDVARAAFDKQRAANGLEPLKLAEDLGVAIPPPHPMGTDPSFPRAWNESSKGLNYTLDQVKNGIMEVWGKTDTARKFDPQHEAILRNVVDKATPRINEIRTAALKIATEERNFTLLNYGERTYADVAKSYIMPYHFFYTRSYKNWITRLATHPDIIAGYAKYKNALEGINKDLPDWYKQQLNINPLAGKVAEGTKMLGMDVSHPLFINLESSINPLYGLTGTDFNDASKRHDFATSTIDDMGKFGPTLWAPIQMAIAAKLYMDGETDAASAWGGRLIPETAQVKSVTSLFGKPLELDPSILFFSGGIEKTDRGRMGYAAAELIKQGENPEDIQSQFQQQKGPLWDKAYQMAVQSRTASSVSSFFLGTGFKPRGQNDVMVEDMFTKLNKLYTMSDMMSSDQYKTAWEQLRSQYPDGLVDTVLLAKKGGAKRDAAYAFSVLGRLPPTEMTQLFKDIGIGDKDVQKFYESKGFSDPKVKFTETEKSRFMDAIIDLGAMLKIPDSATRTEWNSVRNMYADDLKDISAQVGVPYSGKDKGVWDLVSHYYDLKDANPQLADQFTQQHPEVMLALQLKQQAIAESPSLAAYYGGIDSIEAYVSGKVRQELSDKYGPEIYQLQSEYFMTENQKAFMRQHPELNQFFEDKKKLDVEADRMFLGMAGKLPEIKPAQFQKGYTPQSGVQDTLYNNLQPKGQFPQWEQVSAELPNWMQQEIGAYVQNGEKISNRAKNEMGFLASKAGYANANEYLRNVALAYQQYMYQPQPAQQQSAGVNIFGQ